jgi:hypothetical protein
VNETNETQNVHSMRWTSEEIDKLVSGAGKSEMAGVPESAAEPGVTRRCTRIGACISAGCHDPLEYCEGLQLNVEVEKHTMAAPNET